MIYRMDSKPNAARCARIRTSSARSTHARFDRKPG